MKIYHGFEYTVDFLPPVQIQMGVKDDQVSAAIVAKARTGKIGDSAL